MSAYDLKSVSLPKLQGGALAAFAATLETPGIGRVLLGKLAKDAGVEVLAGVQLEEAPRSSPLVPARLADPSRVDPPVDLEALLALEVPQGVLSAAQLHEAYAAQTADPVEVAKGVLDAVSRRAEELAIFVAQDREDVLRQAEASRERWARQAPLGPLDGVPVAVKDELDQVPYPTRVGTRFLGREAARSDATCVARLRSAGAVLLGKCNMHEIGINPNGANPNFGLVRNPYDLSRDPGGSSSGSAAAVAAGFCSLAVGADGGGSIRIPAALCGQVGLKATFGRVSEHGAAPLCWTVAHVGPIGASVLDVALGYAVMAGLDPSDANTLVQPAPSLEGLGVTDLSGRVVGIYREWFQHAQPAIVEACERALGQLEAAGAKVVEIEIPELDLARVAHAVTILSEMACSMDQHRDQHHLHAAHVRVNLAVARHFNAADYLRAQRVRARAIAHLDRVFADVDMIATPSTAITAPPIPVRRATDAWSDLSTVTELMRFVFLQNLTGHPALSLPVGYDADGLPIGFQLTGRAWEEAGLLSAAYVVERAVERRAAPGAHVLLA